MNTKKNTYYIGDIARDLGISQRTIRYYEELGFIKPFRTDGGFRTYSARDVDIIKSVIEFKELGMTLEEIGTLFITGSGGPSSEKICQLREALLARRAEIEARMKSCRRGMEQIDRVLCILSGCNSCDHAPGLTCEACLKRHGGELSPIINPLLNGERGKED